MSVSATPPTPSSHVSPWLAPLLYLFGRRLIVPAFFGRITVAGQEHLPTTGPVVLAPTHRSRWDAFMVPYVAGRDVTGRDLRFMVSADETLGLQGWFVRRFGGFAVDTRRPTIASLRHGVELLRAGEVLVIFPEGNIFRERRIQPLKPGLARLALQAEADQPNLGVQIVPLVIDYSQPIPSWGCEVSIRVGPPLPVSTYRHQGSHKQAAQLLTAELESALKELQSKVVMQRCGKPLSNQNQERS